jgi:crotonobetainyl-CoA:carnitine CoA-transferase CaiB-like acyl-CoA transferase
MLVQAESGVISVTGTEEAPAKVGVSIADLSAGLYAYASILAAMIRRQQTGSGDRIDISMLECLTEWVMPPLYVWHGTGIAPSRQGIRHNMVVPYGAYACADGVVLLAVQTDREWQRFCERVMAASELAHDPRFVSNAERVKNREALERLIEDRFREHARAEVARWLDEADIPAGELNDIPTVAGHPQLEARHRWTWVDSPGGRIPALVPPHNLQSAPARMGPVPRLGEHTDAILAELAAAAQ